MNCYFCKKPTGGTSAFCSIECKQKYNFPDDDAQKQRRRYIKNLVKTGSAKKISCAIKRHWKLSEQQTIENYASELFNS